MPDYQGLGIGHRLSNTIASYFKSIGKGYISITSSPSLIFTRKKDKDWITSRIGRKVSGFSRERITASFVYVGKSL